MSLPSLQLQPISTSHYFTSGDVTIHAGAAIAPGVLIQADPNSCVVIRSGVCIGIGAILHAHNGTIEIGEGVSIGAGVLLVGQVNIGTHACIGSATTIFNSIIEPKQVVPPNSLVGDFGRSGDELQATDTVIYPVEDLTQSETANSRAVQQPEATKSSSSGVNVYGQVYVNKMLVKLFPHHQQHRISNAETQLPPGDVDPWED